MSLFRGERASFPNEHVVKVFVGEDEHPVLGFDGGCGECGAGQKHAEHDQTDSAHDDEKTVRVGAKDLLLFMLMKQDGHNKDEITSSTALNLNIHMYVV